MKNIKFKKKVAYYAETEEDYNEVIQALVKKGYVSRELVEFNRGTFIITQYLNKDTFTSNHMCLGREFISKEDFIKMAEI